MNQSILIKNYSPGSNPLCRNIFFLFGLQLKIFYIPRLFSFDKQMFSFRGNVTRNVYFIHSFYSAERAPHRVQAERRVAEQFSTTESLRRHQRLVVEDGFVRLISADSGSSPKPNPEEDEEEGGGFPFCDVSKVNFFLLRHF